MSSFPVLLVVDTEAAKLAKHLSLLRQEYVKLQNRLLETEQKLGLAAASMGESNEDSFISQLLKMAADLFEKESFRWVLMPSFHALLLILVPD